MASTAKEKLERLEKENAKLKKTNARLEKRISSKMEHFKTKVKDIFLDDLFNWTEFKADPDDVFQELFDE